MVSSSIKGWHLLAATAAGKNRARGLSRDLTFLPPSQMGWKRPFAQPTRNQRGLWTVDAACKGQALGPQLLGEG